MGIQINGTTDVISAVDGSLTVLGTELKDLSQLNVTGVATAATLVVSGNASIGGTITYMDVSNVDSIGIITAQQGIQVLANGLDVTGVSTFNGNVSIADSIIHTGDTDTSIRFPAADTITAETGGSERVRIDSSGNVNIDSGAFYFDAGNNRFGVGTTSPSALLHIAGANSAGMAIFEDTAGTNRIGKIFGYAGALFLQSRDDTNYGEIVFRAERPGETPERMRINNSGNVGIATASPSARLHVYGNAVGFVTTLTDGATITPNFASANNFTVTLGGTRTLANPTGLVPGQSGFISIVQDGTGSRTLSWGSYWDFPSATPPTLTTTANGVDVVAYYVRTTTSIAADTIIGIGML